MPDEHLHLPVIHKPSITFIGAGNVATQLALAFRAKGCDILQIISKHTISAKTLAQKVNAGFFTDDISNLEDKADMYIIAVKDDDIPDILDGFPFCLTKNQLLLHTSGTFDEYALRNTARHWGCFYPLQTFQKEGVMDLSNTPFFVQANTSEAIEKLISFAGLISENVHLIPHAQRQKFHLAAVFSNNFTNHLWTLAKEYCENNQLDFNLLWPLINQGLDKAKNKGPENAQTGPAQRNDETTIQNHVKLLKDYAELVNIYQILTVSIQNRHNKHENPERI